MSQNKGVGENSTPMQQDIIGQQDTVGSCKNVAENAAGSEQVGGYKSLRIKPSSGNKTIRRNKNATQQRRAGSRINVDGRTTTSSGIKKINKVDDNNKVVASWQQ